jgi:hypothetical protein
MKKKKNTNCLQLGRQASSTAAAGGLGVVQPPRETNKNLFVFKNKIKT